MSNLSEQTVTDIKFLFSNTAGFDMNLEEWKQPCLMAGESEYEQIDRFANICGGNYTIKNCNQTRYIESVPKTERF